MDDIIKISKSLEKSGLAMKSISERIKNEARKQKDGFLGMLLGTLSASLLLCPLTVKAKIPERGVMRAGKRAIRDTGESITTGQNFLCCLIL